MNDDEESDDFQNQNKLELSEYELQDILVAEGKIDEADLDPLGVYTEQIQQQLLREKLEREEAEKIAQPKKSRAKRQRNAAPKEKAPKKTFSTSSSPSKTGFFTPCHQEKSRHLMSPQSKDDLISKPYFLNSNSPNHQTFFRVNKVELSTPIPDVQITSDFVSHHWPRTTLNEPFPWVEVDENENLKIPSKQKLENPVKTTKIKLHVRKKEDHQIIRKILGTIRWTYNQCVYDLKHKKEPSTLKEYQKELKHSLINSKSEAVLKNPWLSEVSYDIRNMALDTFITALKGNFTKMKQKQITRFEMQFKKKKHMKSETFYVRKRWIIQKRNVIILKLPNTKPMKFWVGKDNFNGKILMDCWFQRLWTGEYYLCVPNAYEVEKKDLSKSKNLKVCSLDPGVRTFQTIFDATHNCAYEVAPSDVRKIVRLCHGLDKLISKLTVTKNAKLKYSYRRAARRMTIRIQNLINEVHKQLAKWLANNYDLIMIPSFEVSQMIKKENRKIGRATVRQMVGWAHYRFRQRLTFKCRQYGCKLAVVNEAYTSKTCSSCGHINYALGGKKVYSCPSCKVVMDRDVNGAKNIFLKNFQALSLDFGLKKALGPTPSNSVTDCCTEKSAKY